MGMSTSIHVAKEQTEEWRKMFAILKNCDELGVQPPQKVERYFDFREVEEVEADEFGEMSDCIADGVQCKVDGMAAVDRYAVDMEVMVARGWKYIIFSNSW